MERKNTYEFVDKKILEIIRSENAGLFSRITDSNQEFVEYLNESSFRIWYNREQSGFPLHWHKAVEIIIVLEGSYSAKIRNEQYDLNEGDVLIIPAGELHELLKPDSGSRLICLFDLQALSQLNGFSAINPFISQTVHLTKNENSYMYNRCINLLKQIVREYADKNPFYELVIYARVLSLYVTIGRYKTADANADDIGYGSKHNELSQKLAIAFEYIDSHYTENVTLEKVAAVAGFSKFHFSRLFKQCSGQNFHEYLCYKRIQASETMLLKPDYSITEIAFKSGFASLSSFNRAFRTINNCSPTEYRMLYQCRPETTNS